MDRHHRLGGGHSSSTQGNATVGTSLARLGAAGLVAALVSLPSASQAASVFDIKLVMDPADYTGQQNLVDALRTAETFWEGQISGYRTPGLAAAAMVQGPSFTIETSFEALGSRVLGAATGVSGRNETVPGSFPVFVDTTIQSDGFFLHSQGQVIWNTQQNYSTFSQLALEKVAIHEFAHALGFNPRIFGENGLIPFDASLPIEDQAKYTGARALDAYRGLIGRDVEFIPLEQDGGSGTILSHWDEFEFLDYGINAGIPEDCALFAPTFPDCFQAQSFEERRRLDAVLDNPEIMTGFLSTSSTDPLQISAVTLAAFEDIGYALSSTTAAPVPVPPAGPLLIGGLVGLAAIRRRTMSSLNPLPALIRG